MTLGFSTKWPKSMRELAGQSNYFPEKILSGMLEQFEEYENKSFSKVSEYIYDYGMYAGYATADSTLYSIDATTPKLHTIREDPYNRWKAGMDIHMVINNRTKDRFQFAPVLKCVSVQEIEIKYLQEIQKYYTWTDVWSGGNRRICVYIDGNMADSDTIINLAINDGFPSIEAFFQYFNDDFKGKLVHWVDLKY